MQRSPIGILNKGITFLNGTMARKGYLSVVDQAVVSGSNFLTGVLLGRFIAPAEFGVFVIAWTTMMIALSLQNALVCTPMSVIGVQKSVTESTWYWGSLFMVQVLLSVGICLFILIVGLILGNASFISHSHESLSPLISATIVCCFLSQFQEFFRRLLIVKLELWETLLNDAVTNILRIGGLLLLFSAGKLDVFNSLVVVSVSFVIGACLGYLRLRKDILFSLARLHQDFKENWGFGKWVMAEMLPNTLSIQGYIYITAFFIGAQSTAALGASQNILNATNILILSFSNIMTPVASKRFIEGGNQSLTKLMMKVGILAAVPIMGFYLLAMVFAEKILVLVYKQNYAGYGSLFVICSIYYIFSFFNRFLQIMLYAKKKPNIGFLAKTASLIVMVILAYPLLKYYGVYGAAAGTVISQIVILAGFLFYLTRNIRHEVVA
jgi:O-antigen/teichoic acid export membrane protein